MYTRRSGARYGSGFKMTPLTTEKMAVAAPTPSASVSTAMIAKPGERARMRRPCLKSRKNDGTQDLRSRSYATILRAARAILYCAVVAKPKKPKTPAGESASRLIDQRIRELGGWRGETLARMRALILEADPEVTEEWKWRGTPVW